MKGFMRKFTFAAISIAVACGLDHNHNTASPNSYKKPYEELDSVDFQELFGKAHEMIEKNGKKKVHTTSTLLLPRRKKLDSLPMLRKKHHISAKQVDKGLYVENSSTLGKDFYSKEGKNGYAAEENALYVQKAKHCSVKREKEGNGNYSLFVEMIGLNVVTKKIADLPFRKVHDTPSLLFSAAFETFFESKPNAVLSFQDSSDMHDDNQTGRLLNIVVEAIEPFSDRDNVEKYRYKIDEPDDNQFFEALFVDNKSNMYNQCTVFIDAVEANTPGLFFQAQSKIVNDAAQQLKNSNIGKGPDMVDEDFIKKKAGTFEGMKTKLGSLDEGDKYDAIAQVATLTDSLSSIAIACNNGESSCKGPNVAKIVGNVIMAVGTIVSVAFPPAGLALVLIGALTNLIAGFFTSSNTYISRIPGLTAGMVQDAVTRAIANEQADLDASFLTSITEWLTETQKDTANIVHILNFALVKDIDRVIESYYDTAIQGLNDAAMYVNTMNAELDTIFGDDASGQRGPIKNWLNSCSNCWLNTGNPNFLKSGKANLYECDQNSQNQKKPWNELQTLGVSWINLAMNMQIYITLVREVLCRHSKCDCTLGQQPNECPYMGILLKNGLFIKDLMETANFLLPSVTNGQYNYHTVCQSSSSQWPWNQQCDSAASCNYKYLLVLPDVSQMKQLGQRGKFLKELYYTGEMKTYCQNTFNTLFSQGAFWESIVYGYSGSGEGNQLMRGNCGQATDKAAYGHMDLIAIQNYCPEQADCRNFFNNERNWGRYVECSVSVGDKYTVNGSDNKNNCYQATVGGKFWQKQGASDCNDINYGNGDTLVGSYDAQTSTGASQYWGSGDSCEGHGVNNERAGHIIVRNDCSKAHLVPTVVESPECVYTFNIYVCCSE